MESRNSTWISKSRSRDEKTFSLRKKLLSSENIYYFLFFVMTKKKHQKEMCMKSGGL